MEKERNTGIRLDRNGRFWHDGGEITHQRFRRALFRWLDVLDDGQPIFRLDKTRYAYLEVEDAFLLVPSLRWEDSRVWLTLNDNSQEELRYETLCQHPGDHALYCLARNGRLLTRITTQAYYTLANAIESHGDHFMLNAASSLYPIPQSKCIRATPSPCRS